MHREAAGVVGYRENGCGRCHLDVALVGGLTTYLSFEVGRPFLRGGLVSVWWGSRG